MKTSYFKNRSLARKLTEAVRDPRRFNQAWRLQSDCWSFSYRHRAVLGPDVSMEKDGSVLVVSLADFPQQNKIEGLLAKSLQLKGFSPVILTYRACRYAPQYFRSFGIRRFIFMEDLVDGAISRQAAQDAARILSEPLDFKTLMHLSYRGSEVGRHLLSTLTRNMLVGSVNLKNPAVVAFLAEWLPKSLQAVLAAEKLFDRIHPQKVLVNERGYTPYGEIFDSALARGVDTLQWVGAQSKGAFILKRYSRDTKSLHPFSVSPKTWNAIRSAPWPAGRNEDILDDLKNRYASGTWFDRKYTTNDKVIQDPGEVASDLGLDRGKKTAVIFSHVLWDATFFFGESLFDSYEEWLLETVRAASDNPRVNWIVKIHPDYVWKLKLIGKTGEVSDITAIRSRFGKLPGHIKLMMPETKISTYSLFSLADYCLTVRGTIGIEMPCHGIPVLTAGTGRYAGLGFTFDSASQEDYLSKVRSIDRIPPMTPEQIDLARRHAYTLFKVRPWRFRSFELLYRALDGNPLAHDFKLCLTSFDQLLKAEDLNAFSEWAASSAEPDYLCSEPETRCRLAEDAAISSVSLSAGGGPR